MTTNDKIDLVVKLMQEISSEIVDTTLLTKYHYGRDTARELNNLNIDCFKLWIRYNVDSPKISHLKTLLTYAEMNIKKLNLPDDRLQTIRSMINKEV